MARPGISTKNTEKIPPGPKFWTPRIYPQNTEKIPKMRIFGILGVFFRYFRGILGVNSGSPEFRPGGVFFRYFSWKFWVGPSRGSVAGRGALKALVQRDSILNRLKENKHKKAEPFCTLVVARLSSSEHHVMPRVLVKKARAVMGYKV